MIRLLVIALGVGLLAPSAQAQTTTLDDRKALIEDLTETANVQQLERKARSILQIEEIGVPVLDHLPVIADVGQSQRRSSREVADRALALMIVAVKGETADQVLTEHVIADYKAEGLFTPLEQVFVDAPNPTQDQLVQMSWRYEGVAVLLWAVGLIDTLPPPDQIIDASILGNVFRTLGPDGLVAKADLRPQSEVLDMADLYYRLHWAAVDARVNDRPAPEGLHPGITFERLYALNWLYGYAGLSWDDMRTDT